MKRQKGLDKMMESARNNCRLKEQIKIVFTTAYLEVKNGLTFQSPYVSLVFPAGTEAIIISRKLYSAIVELSIGHNVLQAELPRDVLDIIQ